MESRKRGMTRRDFMKTMAVAGAAANTPGLLMTSGNAFGATGQKGIPPMVVHVHDVRATNWDYKTGWYGDGVDQKVVDAMLERGIMALTGKGSVTEAWRVILPAYQPGQMIAVKVNFNNAIYGSSGQVIDAIPQPVNALVKGLKSIGVREDDVWVYDVTHAWHISQIPFRFMNKISPLYPGVQFHSNDDLHTVTLGFSDTERVHFSVPEGRKIPDRRIGNTLVKATYLINMPIIKKHRMAGVSLSFKNHFGSIEGNDLLHWSVTLEDPLYLTTYSSLVDLHANHHFRDKTVLTIGDALYGARINNYTEVPSPWPTFGNKSPNSLFFSRDPVAIDSVMYDFLEAEGGVPKGSDNYLKLAATRGLGVFEHRDASGRYRSIDYRRIT